MKKVWFNAISAPKSWVCNAEPIEMAEVRERKNFARRMVEGYRSVLRKLDAGEVHPLAHMFDDLKPEALRAKAVSMIREYEPQM